MPKESHIGICKLCLQAKELQDSHLIGRAIYKAIREDGEDPVVMTPEIHMSTSRQVRAHLLCWDCEQLFSKNGEAYFSKMMRRRNSFTLLTQLTCTSATRKRPGQVACYSGRRAGVKTEPLAYYALSFLWRAGVHQWITLGRQTTSVELVSHEEQMRRYLLSEIDFPREIAINISVCTDFPSQLLVFNPARYDDDGRVRYQMLVRGIYFRIAVGSCTAEFRDACCVQSLDQRIFVTDCEAFSKPSFLYLQKNAKIAENVRRQKGGK